MQKVVILYFFQKKNLCGFYKTLTFDKNKTKFYCCTVCFNTFWVTKNILSNDAIWLVIHQIIEKICLIQKLRKKNWRL